jgi:hypothetical protein
MQISAPGLKNILNWGRKINEYTRKNRRSSKKLEQDQGF